MTINYILVNNTFFMKPNVELFIKIVYDNFYDIAHNPKLKHTPEEIERTLMSPKFRGFIAKDNKKIIGYLLGEFHVINNRKIFFISYLYTSRLYRNKGVASNLMDMAIKLGKKNKVKNIMLNCDTENKKVYNFYEKRGFMPDLVMRTYDRYEVMSLVV